MPCVLVLFNFLILQCYCYCSEFSKMYFVQEAHIKGVDQDEGLAKMLDSDSSSEDEEKKKKNKEEVHFNIHFIFFQSLQISYFMFTFFLNCVSAPLICFLHLKVPPPDQL